MPSLRKMVKETTSMKCQNSLENGSFVNTEVTEQNKDEKADMFWLSPVMRDSSCLCPHLFEE